MKFRDHRGGLAESMATLVEIDPTMDALKQHLSHRSRTVDAETLQAEPYGPDDRIGWAATFVIRDRHGVLGFTDEMPA